MAKAVSNINKDMNPVNKPDVNRNTTKTETLLEESYANIVKQTVNETQQNKIFNEQYINNLLTQILQRIEKQENNNTIIIERLTKLEQKLEATNKQQITHKQKVLLNQ